MDTSFFVQEHSLFPEEGCILNKDNCNKNREDPL